jgi:OmpA-OmpF porin, OOP family
MTRAVVSLTSLVLLLLPVRGAIVTAAEPQLVRPDQRLEVAEVVRQLQSSNHALSKTRSIRKAADASTAGGLSLQVPFAYDSAQLPARSEPQLQALAQGILALEPNSRIRIVGHTDAMGSADYNDALSLRRATAVRDRLTQLGVPVTRFELAGLGSRQPLSGLAPAAPQNRRVEVLRSAEDSP